MSGFPEGFRERLAEGSGFLPAVMDYTRLLDLVTKKKRISRDEARDLYGNYTWRQWKALLENRGNNNEED